MKRTASQCLLAEYDWVAVENGTKEGRAACFLQLIQPHMEHLLQVTVHWDLAFRPDAAFPCKLKGSVSEMTTLAWR